VHAEPLVAHALELLDALHERVLNHRGGGNGMRLSWVGFA
jgi:hypothetical protein